MTSPPAPKPNISAPSGLWTLITSGITILTMLVGALVIRPRLTERRVMVDDRYILTATEVRALPPGTLAVVLDRAPGQNEKDFPYRLLQLVLERSGRPYALGLSEQDITQDEAVAALEQEAAVAGRNPLAISVGVFGAGLELNRRLKAVTIPVTGGILGLRAGWTHRDHVEHLATLRSPADLRSIVLLQGLGWSDVEIFDAAGLRTFTARSEDLFRLVDNQRVQLFPRGIAELEREAPIVQASTAETLLDPTLLIAYPFAGFFYVSRSNQPLAAAIKDGFEKAIADGSYQRLLEELILTPWLRRNLRLADRTIVVLPNPMAAAVFAEVDPRYWIVPWGDLLKGNVVTGSELCQSPGFRKLCP